MNLARVRDVGLAVIAGLIALFGGSMIIMKLMSYI